MKHLENWVIGLVIGGVIGIPVGMVFNFTLRVLIIISWSTYTLLCLYFITKVPKRLGFAKEEWFFDELQTKWSTSALITGFILVILSILGAYFLYKSSTIKIYSQTRANWTSTHIKFQQGETPCISLGEECK